MTDLLVQATLVAQAEPTQAAVVEAANMVVQAAVELLLLNINRRSYV
jgi:hypothetical protein